MTKKQNTMDLNLHFHPSMKGFSFEDFVKYGRETCVNLRIGIEDAYEIFTGKKPTKDQIEKYQKDMKALADSKRKKK